MQPAETHGPRDSGQGMHCADELVAWRLRLVTQEGQLRAHGRDMRTGFLDKDPVQGRADANLAHHQVLCLRSRRRIQGRWRGQFRRLV